ncbi:MAG: hypothetical protein WCQ60_00945 [bacterium]
MKKNTQPAKAESSLGKKVALGAGLAAIAAAAAGTYFLYGAKNAAKNRKQVKAWSLKAKGEVLEKLEKMSDVNEEIYHKVVAQVADKYTKLKNIDASDVADFADELKGHWKSIAKEIGISKK